MKRGFNNESKTGMKEQRHGNGKKQRIQRQSKKRSKRVS